MCCLFNYISKTKMDDFRRFLNKQLEDPGFRKEWEETGPEYMDTGKIALFITFPMALTMRITVSSGSRHRK